MLFLFSILMFILGGVLLGCGFSNTPTPHVHDFYDYGENFTFVNPDMNTCALLFCACGETREIELGPNGWNSDDYKKEIL